MKNVRKEYGSEKTGVQLILTRNLGQRNVSFGVDCDCLPFINIEWWGWQEKNKSSKNEVFQYLEVIGRTKNCSFIREKLNMRQTLRTISMGSCRPPIMPPKKQQQISYTTWCSDFWAMGDYSFLSWIHAITKFHVLQLFLLSRVGPLQFNSLINNIDHAQRV